MRRGRGWQRWIMWMPRVGKRLRTQLFVSFAVVALVALVAAGSAVVWLMLGYRTQATHQRLRDAASGAAAAAAALERQGASSSVIAGRVADQVPLPSVRVLVLDSRGTVIAEETASDVDEGDIFTGTQLTVPHPGGSTFPGLRRGPPEDGVVWRENSAIPAASGYVFVAARVPPPGRPSRGPGSGPGGGPQRGPLTEGPMPVLRPERHRIVLAIPRQSLPSAWQEVLPGLAAAGAIALAASAVVAWWLAGSIARPIRAVTEATERVARGEPHRQIPEQGVEEVAQLAHGFNAMAREVERSHASLRNFVANASHELRTPLTAIQGFSQAVTDGVLEAPEPTRDAIGFIHREAERMRRLVEDLLLLSKVEARDRAVTQETVEVTSLVDAVVERLQPTAADRGLRIDLDLPDQLFAEGDAAEIEHLFGNLIENAVKYSPQGATITVRGALVPVDGRPHLSIFVHNTGSYIPPEDLPYIFDRFYRVEKSRSREVAGSGLGLAIAHEVVERHGGTIKATSDQATGTTFTVTLPASRNLGDPTRLDTSALMVGERYFSTGTAAGSRSR